MDNFNRNTKEWTYIFESDNGYVWLNSNKFPNYYWLDKRTYFILHKGELFATNNHAPINAQNGLCKIEP